MALPDPGTALAAGTYTKAGFVPSISLTVDDGWSVGESDDGSFTVRTIRDGAGEVSVGFARVQDVIGPSRAPVRIATASDAVAAIKGNPGLAVIDESGSRMSGLEGLNVVIEHGGEAPTTVLADPVGEQTLAPGHRLWLALFDTADGVVAVMVAGATSTWEPALTVAEPVLESVVIDATD